VFVVVVVVVVVEEANSNSEVEVKFAYEPSSLSGWRLSRFSGMERLGVFLLHLG